MREFILLKKKIKKKLKLMIISHSGMYARVYFIKKKLKLMIISHLACMREFILLKKI
jgi:hypothetical protein